MLGLVVAVGVALPAPAVAQSKAPNCNYSETRLTIIDEYAPDDPGSVAEAGLSEREAMEDFKASLNVSDDIKDALAPEKFESHSSHERGATYGRVREGRTVALIRLERTSLNLWRVREAVACGELWQGPEPPPQRQPESQAFLVTGGAMLVAAVVVQRGRRPSAIWRRALPVFLCVALVSTAAAVTTSHKAAAHCADSNSCGGDYDWYPSEWQADHHTGLSISYRFTTPFPDGAKRDRVIESFERWNGQGQQMQFHRLADVADFTIECEDTSSPHHGIFWRDIYPLARTFQCDHPRWDGSRGDTLHEFHITFDSTRSNWHDYLGVPDAGEIDFFSVAMHEVGHATGFRGKFDDGHFDGSGALCPSTAGTSFHTMCPQVFDENIDQRSLAEHDMETFDNAYPNQ